MSFEQLKEELQRKHSQASKYVSTNLGGINRTNLVYLGKIGTSLPAGCFFVFGSNPTGEHGPVTAEYAKKHSGAIAHVSCGWQGQSYGIPTVALENDTIDVVSGTLYKTMKF